MRRLVLAALWVVLVAAALYLFAFERTATQHRLASLAGTSFVAASGLYLALGCIRGFTLIPSTSLVLLAVTFFPPVPLFVLTLAGILVSSTGIYYFAEALELDRLLARHHGARLAQLRDTLARHELPIIIGWSFFPLAPTDLVVYLCGLLRVSLVKCLAGVLVGEGTICAIYIFGGDHLLRWLQLK